MGLDLVEIQFEGYSAIGVAVLVLFVVDIESVFDEILGLSE